MLVEPIFFVFDFSTSERRLNVWFLAFVKTFRHGQRKEEHMILFLAFAFNSDKLKVYFAPVHCVADIQMSAKQASSTLRNFIN